MAEVSAAVREALGIPAISFDAVKHLLLCAIECRVPKLDLGKYPHLPVAEVALSRLLVAAWGGPVTPHIWRDSTAITKRDQFSA